MKESFHHHIFKVNIEKSQSFHKQFLVLFLKPRLFELQFLKITFSFKRKLDFYLNLKKKEIAYLSGSLS